ncbi:MAG: trypsin-like peptidase domain-containing protein [Planctomycetaceae bacterium]|nr:trypsin-like peptidase domain-containing protein [Planctomycetaceae bacterium]
MRTDRVGMLIVLLASWAAIGQAQPPAADSATVLASVEDQLVKVIGSAESSVVALGILKREAAAVRVDGFGLEIQPRPTDELSPEFFPNEFGSGVLITAGNSPEPSAERLVLTAYHLVRGGPIVGKDMPADRALRVRLPGRQICDAKILAADPRSDLAVLRLDLTGTKVTREDLKPFKLSEPIPPRKGQFVISLGNPYAIARDGSASASWGIISNISRFPAPANTDKSDLSPTRRDTSIHHLGTLLHIDTRLNLGGSGGALLNLRGELIGLTTSLAAIEGYEKSVGYAIPIDANVRRVIESLSKGLEVEYGFLGLQPDDCLLAPLRHLPPKVKQASAARVLMSFTDSPAAVAGVRRDDVILAVNRRPIFGKLDLLREIGLLGPGVFAELTIWREADRREFTLHAELGKWPLSDEETLIATEHRHPEWRGLRVDYPTSRYKYMNWPEQRYPAAVVVTAVTPQSSAANVELQEGDFITHVEQHPVHTPDEFHAVIRKLDKPNVLVRTLDGRRLPLKR